MMSKAGVVGGRARRRAARQRGEPALRRAVGARRELAGRGHAGRVWLNGRDLGGTPARRAYLEASHD
jgi:hypothetical protein